MGIGGCNVMVGFVFYLEDFVDVFCVLFVYYDGKLFIYEWMCGFIGVVIMDEEGNYEIMEYFMFSMFFSNFMDMVFVDNGDFYMLEYGQGWFV